MLCFNQFKKDMSQSIPFEEWFVKATDLHHGSRFGGVPIKNEDALNAYDEGVTPEEFIEDLEGDVKDFDPDDL